MNLIPLIHIRKNKLYQDNSNHITIKEILQSINKETQIYFIDYDGIEKNKPNFCTYQKIATQCKPWIDHGPRSLGDIVDIVMAGAEKITFRKTLCPHIDIPSIRNVIDGEIYEYFTAKDITNNTVEPPSLETDGIVIQIHEINNVSEKTHDHTIPSFGKKYPICVIEQDKNKFSYWKNKEISSVITNFSTWIKEKNHDY